MLIAFGSAEVIARGKGMLSIEAELQTVAILHQLKNLMHMLKTVSQSGALTSSNFQGDADPKARTGGMNGVNGPGNIGEPRGFSNPYMRPGMRNQGSNPQRLASFHIRYEGLQRFIPQHRVGGGQVE